jgi:hypothetical protein
MPFDRPCPSGALLISEWCRGRAKPNGLVLR